MHLELLITNIGLGISFVITLGLSILVFARRLKGGSLNTIFILFSLSTCLWILPYGLGINLHDPHLSRFFFMIAVLAPLFTILFNSHLILAITDRVAPQKRMLTVLYTIAVGIVLFFALFPDTLLLPSAPKLYLTNFMVPGSLYSIQDYFFFFCCLYVFYIALTAYHHSDYRQRNKLKYVILGMIYGYGVNFFPALLLYDLSIPIDPLPAAFFGFYTIPFAYAILKYDLVNINFLAKRAFGYALSITGVALFIIFIGYTNELLHSRVPNFPEWILPFVSALIAVAVGVSVWKKIKEVDILKYQFVDVVTHKFRTPLTHIKWSLENLKTSTAPEEREKAMADIADAHMRLFQLTDTLIGLSSSDNSQFLYSYERESIRKTIDETGQAIADRLREKRVTLKIELPENIPDVFIDHRRVQFAVQMIVENAVTYSTEGGQVEISAESKGGFVILSVHDTGIGITKEDLGRLFSKFFRSDKAMLAHTEGLGIGLYISRDILRRHGGDLWAESEGPGKGSTFFLKIPVAR